MFCFLFTHSFSLHHSLLLPLSIEARPLVSPKHPSCPSFIRPPSSDPLSPLAPPMRLKRFHPSSTPLPLDDDSVALHLMNLSSSPPSAYWLMSSPCTPSSAWLCPTTTLHLSTQRLSPCTFFPLDDDSTALDSMALSLRPFFRLAQPDDNFVVLRSTALSLRPSSVQRFLTSPYAPLSPNDALHPCVQPVGFCPVPPMRAFTSDMLPSSLLNSR
jgi:hypothetical protein